MLKVDEDGTKIWATILSADQDSQDLCYSVQQTQDGGYILAGCTSSPPSTDTDFLLIKTDSTGAKMWSRSYGGKSDDVAESVIQTSDNGYFITGFTRSAANIPYDIMVIKTDAFGEYASR